MPNSVYDRCLAYRRLAFEQHTSTLRKDLHKFSLSYEESDAFIVFYVEVEQKYHNIDAWVQNAKYDEMDLTSLS